MPTRNDFDVYVGGKSGVFKGVKIGKECTIEQIQNLVSITANDQVSTIAWGNDEEKEILIACGEKANRSVKVYDTEASTFTCAFFCNVGEGRINGVSRYNDAILTAVHSGELKLWKFDRDEIVLDAGKNLNRMRHSKINRNIIATGGEEHPLKLFDLETKTKIFTEKNLPHDFLQLRVPIWISDIGFLPNSEEIATVGRYGHIRLYDPKAQKRPVIKIENKDEAYTCLSILPREKQIIVGTGRGRMNLVDLRKPGKILNTYRGFTGAVNDIACSKYEPYVVSTSLDRFLRIHHVDTKQLVKKVYLSSRSTCMLLSSSFIYDEKTDDNQNVTITLNSSNENCRESDIDNSCKMIDPDSDTEYNTLFSKMPIVSDKKDKKLTKTKRKVSEAERQSDVEIISYKSPGRENKKPKLTKKMSKETKTAIKMSSS